MLKLSYNKKEDIPAGLEEHYKENGGKFVAELEGVKTQEDVDRVQEALRKEREDHSKTKGDLKETQSALGTAKDELAAFQKGNGPKGKDEPTHEDLVELARLQRENESLSKERDELKESYASLSTEVTSGKIKDALRAEAAKKFRPEAVEHEVDTASRNFVFSDGKILTNPELGDTGGLTADEFFSRQLSDRPYLAIPSNSGGAGGGSKRQDGDQPGNESSEEFYGDMFS